MTDLEIIELAARQAAASFNKGFWRSTSAGLATERALLAFADEIAKLAAARGHSKGGATDGAPSVRPSPE